MRLRLHWVVGGRLVWRDDYSADSDLHNARVLAGLRLWMYGPGDEIYLGKLNAMLGANRRWLCEP